VPVAPHVRHPGVPRALSEVLMRALAKRPEERYPTAAALRTALEAALRAGEGEGRAPPPRALPAQWLRPDGEPARVQVRVVSRTGLLVALPAPLPPLHAELPLLLEGPEGRQLPCRIRVVQHVGEAQAATWGVEPGVAAELLDATPTLLAHLRRLQAGERLEASAQAEGLLREMAAVPVGDPYALLGLPRDADGTAVAHAARAVRTRLEALLGQPLPAEARSRARTLLERVARAHHTLTTPERRAECDAALGNFRGVVRCMEMGLSADGLQRLQHAWHTRHPNLAGQAAVHFLSARALERAGQLTEALAAYERSLCFDPLDLVCLQQHHALLRRLHVQSAASAPARRPGNSPPANPARDGGMASAGVSSRPGLSARR
jgi:serine/threonine-protein kinase